MSGAINIRALPVGARITLNDGAVAEVTSNPADGVWLFARYVDYPADASRVGEEDMIFAQSVVEVGGD